jgi:hypothetical protein
MRERWRSATDTAWYELSPASPERLGEAAWGCSGLSLNGRNCVQNTRSATSATAHPPTAPRQHASHRDRPVCGIHHYKYQSLNELTSENQIHSPLTSGPRTAPRPGPGPAPDSRLRNWAAPAPARGGRALGAGCVRLVAASVVWVRRGPVTRPSRVRAPTRCFRGRQSRTGTAATHAGARSRSHDTELHSCQCHRHETHTVHIQYTRHSSVLCAACQTQRGHLVHASSSARKSWPAMAPPEGWPQTRTNAAACTVPPSRTDVTDVNGCYRMVYDVVCTGAVLLFAGVVSLHRVAISSAISSRSASDSN